MFDLIKRMNQSKKRPSQDIPKAPNSVQFLLGVVMLFAGGVFLVFESIFENHLNLTMAGVVAIMIGCYGLIAKRNAITQKRLVQSLFVVPLVFGCIFSLGGLVGLITGVRWRVMMTVSKETSTIELITGICFFTFALAAWAFLKIKIFK
jgi:drug/metabolite transporter (DMT)-like permease